MKKRFLALLLSAVLCLSLGAPALAAGGGEQDPVVSQSYLEQVWKQEILKEVSKILGQSMQHSRSAALAQLADSVGAARLQHEQSYLGIRYHLGRLMLKQGDIFTPGLGAKFTIYSGSLTSGAGLVNVSEGKEVDPSASATLRHNQLYMQKDMVSQELMVTSPTLEIWIDGSYELQLSGALDYGSLAMALNKMGLFKGMTSGFSLETTTTRAQGLVMFLRLMGLEDEALATTAKSPFKDVGADHWAHQYVAYAYKEGFTAGTSATAFSPNAPVTAQHYLTFLMRALKYAENREFSYNTVLTDAVEHELFTTREVALLSQDALTRYKMVYLSYYGLFCFEQEQEILLLEMLMANGSITQEQAMEGIAQVKCPRLR